MNHLRARSSTICTQQAQHSRRRNRRGGLNEPRRWTRAAGERLVPWYHSVILAAPSTRFRTSYAPVNLVLQQHHALGKRTDTRTVACRRGTARPRYEGFLTAASALATVASLRETFGSVLPPPPHLLLYPSRVLHTARERDPRLFRASLLRLRLMTVDSTLSLSLFLSHSLSFSSDLFQVCMRPLGFLILLFLFCPAIFSASLSPLSIYIYTSILRLVPKSFCVSLPSFENAFSRNLTCLLINSIFRIINFYFLILCIYMLISCINYMRIRENLSCIIQ